jgi:hypothetical protein
MTRSKLASFACQNGIALLALFIALGGTGYAATKLNGKNIRRHTIRGTALKNNTLTGKQIKESKLGKVPKARHADTADTATTATNATALNGVAAASYLHAGCGPGKVNGYATINGDASSFPKTYTTAAPFIQNSFNCSGQPVEVRRDDIGFYHVKFPGNPGTTGFANAEVCSTSLCPVMSAVDVGLTPVSGGPDAGSFAVRAKPSGSTGNVDWPFSVLIT